MCRKSHLLTLSEISPTDLKLSRVWTHRLLSPSLHMSWSTLPKLCGIWKILKPIEISKIWLQKLLSKNKKIPAFLWLTWAPLCLANGDVAEIKSIFLIILFGQQSMWKEEFSKLYYIFGILLDSKFESSHQISRYTLHSLVNYLFFFIIHLFLLSFQYKV